MTARRVTTTGRTTELAELARRLVWWQEPERTLARPERLVAQAMTDGTWEEVELVRQTFGEPVLRAVLTDPPPGVFDARSWNYWHLVLGMWPVPPLPRRRLP